MSGLRPNLKLGALGGPNTFGGDASRQMTQLYPEFSEMLYFHTAEEGFAFDGGNDAMCAPQQMARTGFHPKINGYIADHGSKLYVICDITHVYHCSLLVKPDTSLSDVKEVRGHTGSITQSRRWIEKHLPQAEIHIVHTSSHAAAQEVSEGDGSIASVGTPGMAQQFGLEQAGKEIDGGSSANYWAISPHPLFSSMPNRVVVAGRFIDDGAVGGLIGSLAEVGFLFQTIFTQPSGERLYEHDCILRFGGRGRLGDVQAALRGFPAARLAGAYEARD